MKEVEIVLKTVADALKTMSQGINSLAEKLNAVAQSSPPSKPSEKDKAKTGAKTKPAAKKKKAGAKPDAAKTTSATTEVCRLVEQAADGIETAELMDKTGYDRKKIHNIVYKLKKQGKIKTDGKGRYVRA